MTKRLSLNSMYNYLVIILLLIAVAIRGGADFKWLASTNEPVYTINDIQYAFPDAVAIDQNSDKSFSVLDKGGKTIGLALVSEELDARHQGYGGNVPLLIALDLNKVIKGSYLLSNNETGEFIDHINDVQLLDSWNELPMDTTLLTVHIDAVSGATKSSIGIINTFNKTTAHYLQMEHQKMSVSFVRIFQVLLFFVLLYLSLSMVLTKRFKRFYIYYLVAVLIVMGFWLKKMLSIELLHTWLSKGLSWQSNWELIILLLLAVIMGIWGHKRYYCNYLCPMGALQILVNKLSPFKKRSMSFKISTVTLRAIYLTFIWLCLILGFTLPLGNMEPFMAFSFKVATYLMLGAGGVIILLSVFFNRPWCQLCPTGCLLDSVPSLKKKQ